MLRGSRWMAVLLLISLPAAEGCRGNSSGASSTTTPSGASAGAVQTVLEAYATLFANFGPGLTLALDPNAEADKVTDISANDQLRQFSRQIICDPSGNGSMDGSVDDRMVRGTVAIDIDFRNCSGVGGTIDIVGAFQRSTDSIDLQWNYADSGQAHHDGCTLDLSHLTATSSVSLISATLADSQLTGALTAACSNGALVTCVWDGVNVTDAAGLAQGCQCTGSGC